MKPAVSYIICSVQQSGTHLLCDILASTGVAGQPGHDFFSTRKQTWEERAGVPSRAAYVEGVLQRNTTPNGVFGVVVMWSYFERMIQMLGEIPAYQHVQPPQLLATVFNQPKYIWLRRRDHVQQAVSWAIAAQTKVWSQRPGEKTQSQATPRFDFKVIDQRYNRIVTDEQSWEDYFRENKLEPLTVFYEDMIASNRDVAERILEFLGIPVPSGMHIVPTVEKQATPLSQEWAASYVKLKESRVGTPAGVFQPIRTQN